jgi:cation:H+ antiporter
MTGANRILVGLGWPLMSFLWWWKTRGRSIDLEPVRGGEIFFLGVATVYSFVIPLKGTLTVFDTVILFAIFLFYIRFAMKQKVEEPEMHGPAELIGRAGVGARRIITVLLFLYAGATIFASSHPFAMGLVKAGSETGIDERYLVQWLAPLASESPEFVVAAIFAWKGFPTVGFGALVSSKVNQWTLLVGAVPLTIGISRVYHGQSFAGMTLDSWQFAEILLTSAQSFFAVCVLLNRRFDLLEAALLGGLFLAQFLPSIAIESLLGHEDAAAWILWEKHAFSALYMVLGMVYLGLHYRKIPPLLRLAFFPRLAALESVARRQEE